LREGGHEAFEDNAGKRSLIGCGCRATAIGGGDDRATGHHQPETVRQRDDADHHRREHVRDAAAGRIARPGARFRRQRSQGNRQGPRRPADLSALKTSKHYYVTVAQLPVKLPAGQSAIQILYNFQVLVSIAPNGAKPAIKVDSAEIGHNEKGKPIPVVTLSNASAAYGYLSEGRLRIVEKDASGKEVFRRTLSGPETQQTIGFGLVGANQTRRMSLPIELPVEGGSVDVSFTPDG
jgi:hypothetical protein